MKIILIAQESPFMTILVISLWQGQICSMAITDSYVITSGCEGHVKLWDLHSGKFIRNIVVLKSGYLTNITVSESTLAGVLHTKNTSQDYNQVYAINFEKSVNSLGKKTKTKKK